MRIAGLDTAINIKLDEILFQFLTALRRYVYCSPPLPLPRPSCFSSTSSSTRPPIVQLVTGPTNTLGDTSETTATRAKRYLPTVRKYRLFGKNYTRLLTDCIGQACNSGKGFVADRPAFYSLFDCLSTSSIERSQATIPAFCIFRPHSIQLLCP